MTEAHVQRLVDVRCGGDEGWVSSGSGYLIAQSLVLTASHVVFKKVAADGLWPVIRVKVGHPRYGRSSWIEASACWLGAGGLDVALLELSKPVQATGIVRWGRPGGVDPIRYHGVGFPRHSKGANSERVVEQLAGMLQPLAGGSGDNDLYVLDQSASPERRPDGTQAWAGVSGAAVFCRDLLVGVTVVNNEAHKNRRLHAVPVHAFVSDFGFTGHLRRHGASTPVLVPVDARPPVPVSGYRLEVRQQFAAEDFEGRDAEMARMADFCTAADPGGSQYWRWVAPAWSGKTTLMAKFYLDPPQDVDALAFFITSRQLGRSDQTAFLASLQGQLREYLHDPDLTCTSEGHFLHALERATEQARQAGRRLVLLVDGLDEDTGVPDGSSGHSIAALLPRHPPSGLSVVVAGRPDPPVPSDVPDSHPLRDPAIEHPLEVSPAARVAQQVAERDLKVLWEGPWLGRESACLTAAAGGGLSTADLAHMARRAGGKGDDRPPWAAWEVEELLGGNAGRSFQRRPAQWTVTDTGPQALFSLGHDVLHRRVLARMVAALDGYRGRVHAYAETWRQDRWPADTPEYLLIGYPVLLRQLGDAGRLTALATDHNRQECLWRTTGSDVQALSEIRDAFRLLLESPEPDLRACMQLAYSREALIGRGGRTTDAMVMTWAQLGRARRAISLLESGNDPARLVKLLPGILHLDSQQDTVAFATEAARNITDPEARIRALLGPVRALACTGRVEAAVRLAQEAADLAVTITKPTTSPHPVSRVVLELTQLGLADHAVALVRAMPHDRLAGNVPQDIVRLLAQADRIDDAEAFAGTIGDSPQRIGALTHLGRSLADAGRIRDVLELADETVRLARNLKEGERDQAITEAARLLTRAGRADDAITLAKDISHVGRQGNILEAITAVLVEIGSVDRARDLAHTIRPWDRRSSALACVAAALMQAGRLAEAARLAHKIADLSRRLTHQRKAEALRSASRVLAQTGRVKEALLYARSIDLPDRQAVALVHVVQALASAGRADEAVDLAREITGILPHVSTIDRRATTLTNVLGTLTELGRMEETLALARDRTPTALQARVLTAVAQACATDPDRADQALVLAHAIDNPDRRGEALARVAEVLAEAGCADAAADLAVDAVPLVRAMNNPDRRARALADVAWTLSRTGCSDTAATLVHEGMALARRADSQHLRGEAQAAVVRALVDAGQTGAAARIARMIEQPDRRGMALIVVTGALARSGRPEEAVELAQTIEELSRRAQALGATVQTLAESGRLDDAREIAEMIDDPDTGAAARTLVVRALAESDRVEQALQLAHSIARPDRRADALGVVVRALAEAGRADEAVALVQGVTDAVPRSRFAIGAVRAMAQAGRPDQVRQLLGHIEGREQRDRALHGLVRTLADTGQIDDALSELRNMPESEYRDAVQLYVVRSLVRHRGADAAMVHLGTIPHPKVRSPATISVVRKLAWEGRPVEALTLARKIPYSDRQAQALAAVIHVFVEQERGTEAMELARTMARTDRQSQELIGVVRTWAEEERTADALELADTITHTHHHAQALAAAIPALVRVGRTDDALQLAGEAATAARAVTDPEDCAQVLLDTALAMAAADHADGDTWLAAKHCAEARTFIAEALSVGPWGVAIKAIAVFAPEILGDLVGLVTESGDSPA
ncbi:trypsin-like serine protease [Streptomyces avermitilis]|uniref:trypsin-like serine protease n=1 Tax=Streptomyces avermitilis TaxID=33903 RepID=UPI0036C0ACF1